MLAGAAVAIGAVVAAGFDRAVAQWPAVSLGALVASLFTGAGNAMNDVYDRETDRVNHPNRPIPAGLITPGSAVNLAFGMFALAAFLSVFINLPAFGLVLVSLLPFGLVLVSLLLMIAYEKWFKASGWSGNLVIAWLVGSLFLFGSVCVYEGRVRPIQIGGSLALLAGLSTVAREVVKDMEDLAGDVDRATLPKRRGLPFAARVAQVFLVLTVGLSAVPAILGILGLPYVGIVLVADAIFIYAALHAMRSPRRSERAMKGAMALALVAFLAGGLA